MSPAYVTGYPVALVSYSSAGLEWIRDACEWISKAWCTNICHTSDYCPMLSSLTQVFSSDYPPSCFLKFVGSYIALMHFLQNQSVQIISLLRLDCSQRNASFSKNAKKTTKTHYHIKEMNSRPAAGRKLPDEQSPAYVLNCDLNLKLHYRLGHKLVGGWLSVNTISSFKKIIRVWGFPFQDNLGLAFLTLRKIWAGMCCAISRHLIHGHK